jgi:hypothetical protein
MTRSLKSALVGTWIGVQILPAFAEAPPSFNVGSSCSGSVAGEKSRETCLVAERAARSELNKTWSQYSERAKTVCMGVVSSGGAQSYVELITCLETMTAANPARNVEQSEPADSKTIERKPIRPVVAKPKNIEIDAPMVIHPSQVSTPEPNSVPPKADGENLLGKILRSVTGMFGKN